MDISGLMRGMDEYRRRALAAARAGLAKAAAATIERSRVYCPKGETGSLAASGAVGEMRVSGSVLIVEIGHSAAHAAIVHEDLTAQHEAPTGAKFLERAMRETAAAGSLAAMVAQEVRAA